MSAPLDAALLVGWVRAATTVLERHCAELDRINVFPVPDGDTGTNLLLTVRAAGDAVGRGLRERAGPDGAAPVAAALARGALLGARGNSGVILSQVFRGVSEAVAAACPGAPADRAAGAAQDGRPAPDGPAPGGAVLADALVRADRLATAAVARPREGTVLTVLRAAAGAARAAPAVLGAVATAATAAAATALEATTGQLPELARAGVVDAGGLGLYLVLDALAGVATGRPPQAAPPGPGPRRVARRRDALVADREAGSPDFDYEVMYLLDGSDDARVVALRAELDGLGDAVALVGDGTPGGAGLWNVHVHCTDVGAAVEAGIAAGRPHRITVVRFADQVAAAVADRFVRERAVVMTVGGPGAAELARAGGAAVLERAADRPLVEDELVAAVVGTRARHVVVLPDDPDLTPLAERAAAAARRDGQEVVVVPTSSVLQGLAALAVHDPLRRAGDDVVAMAEAAAGTRTAALLVAESEALTWVGRCQPGEVLGIGDGEVLLIAPDLPVGGLWLAHRMLVAGGELVTVLLGEVAPDALGEGLAEDLRRTHPEIDVVVLRGGQADYPLVLGVE